MNEEHPSVPLIPIPEAAQKMLNDLQVAAQVSQRQLQIFVDGLALGQGVPEGARLTQTSSGSWVWAVDETTPKG